MLISSRNKLLLVDLKTTQRPIINAFVGLFSAGSITNKSPLELLALWLLIRPRTSHRARPVHLKLACSGVVGWGVPLNYTFLMGKST